jgi:hypothetical protein
MGNFDTKFFLCVFLQFPNGIMDLSEFPDHNIIHFPNYEKFGKQMKHFLTFPPFGKPISDPQGWATFGAYFVFSVTINR